MPGLFGWIRRPGFDSGATRETDEQELDAMASRLRRHPDETVQTHVDPEGRFAVGRIGMSFASTPSWPCGGDGVTVFAAGHPDLDPSGDLGGDYAALVARRGDALCLKADRTAGVPLYFGDIGGALYFAPEVSALLHAPGASREIDLGALGYFVGAGQLCPRRSLFKAFRRLHGGGQVRMTDAGAEVETYWRFVPGAIGVRAGSVESLAGDLADLVRAQTARHYGDPAKTMLFLSGGADSRTLLASALDQPGVSPSQISTITWADYISPDYGDVDLAGRIAAMTGVRHEIVMRDWADYGAKFERMNSLLGASLMAVDHPSELPIMEMLYARGYQRTIRGDAPFCSVDHPADIVQGLSSIGIKPIAKDPRVISLLKPRYRTEIVDQNASIQQEFSNNYRDLSPLSVAHALYFDARMQGYLLQSGYVRQVLFCEQRPLLGDAILDFANETPDSFRFKRSGLYQTLKILWGSRPDVYLGQRNTLNNRKAIELYKFSDLIRIDNEMLCYVRAALDDSDSGIWEYFEQREAKKLLEEALSTAPARSSVVKEIARYARQQINRLSPGLTSKVTAAIKPVKKQPAGIVGSLLALKDWHDTHVSGHKRGFHTSSSG